MREQTATRELPESTLDKSELLSVTPAKAGVHRGWAD